MDFCVLSYIFYFRYEMIFDNSYISLKRIMKFDEEIENG